MALRKPCQVCRTSVDFFWNKCAQFLGKLSKCSVAAGLKIKSIKFFYNYFFPAKC